MAKLSPTLSRVTLAPKFVTGYFFCHRLLFWKFYGYSKFSRVTFGNFHGLLKTSTGYSIKCHRKDNSNGLCYPVGIYQRSLADNHSAFCSRRTQQIIYLGSLPLFPQPPTEFHRIIIPGVEGDSPPRHIFNGNIQCIFDILKRYDE